MQLATRISATTLAGFVFIVTGTLTEPMILKLVYLLLGMGILLAGVLIALSERREQQESEQNGSMEND